MTLRAGAVIIFLALLLVSGPVSAREADRPTEGPAPEIVLASNHARLIVTMSVSRAGDVATYNVVLKNPGSPDVNDVFLAAGIAPGTTFLDAGPDAARNGFRSVEGDNATWLVGRVPANGTAGPFTYRVRLSDDTADPVHAWVHWLRPNDATAVSVPVRVLPSVTFTPLATGPAGALPATALMWRVIDVTIAAQAEETNPGAPIARMIYMTEGTRHFGQEGITASYSAGVGHFIKPGVPFLNANRTDAPARWLQLTVAPAAQRGVLAPPPLIVATSIAYDSDDLVGLGRGPYEFILLRADFQPGGRTALHSHPGPVMVHLLEGTLSHTTNGVSRTQGPGSFWVEQVGEEVTTRNIGSTTARVIAALLVPRGEDPAHFLEAPHPWTFR